MSEVSTRETAGSEARDGVESLAQALLALRSRVDAGTACSIAATSAARALGAAEHRLLRLDPKSGTLRLIDEAGVETPYLPEQDGPVSWVLRNENPLVDDGSSLRERETLLWSRPPAALLAFPLIAAGTLLGCLLLSFDGPRSFDVSDRTLGQMAADALALALHRTELCRALEEESARRSELERRLDANEEASSSLMSLVAHEIRTPLSAIKAYTETLLDTLADPHTPRERFLGVIADECDRLTRLVTDILDLSRLEAGQRPLKLASLDVQSLVEDVAEGLRPLAASRSIRIEVEVEASLRVEADPDLLRRLFVNLLANGVKYANDAGQVQVRAWRDQEIWRAAVEDDGPGIPNEDLPRVFERFFRGTRSAEAGVEGTGLGLAIARGIVELHGGRIAAESPAERGSRFVLEMPLRQVAPPTARRIAGRVLERPDLCQLLVRTVEMVGAAMDAEIVSLMLVDPERGDLFIASSVGLEPGPPGLRRTVVRSGVAGSVLATGRPVLVENIETDRRFLRLNHPQYNTKSLLSVPLQVEGANVGVLNVNNKISRQAFDADDLALLGSLVERVGSAVERAFSLPDSDRVIVEATEAIESITRLKRDGLFGGRSAVALARAVAAEFGLGAAEVDRIGYVAAIRDLGMPPLAGLRRARGSLDEDDRRALAQHPVLGAEIIRPLEYQGAVRELILSHHERWDGSGYPRGLAGQDIPLGARILAVVDAWESMVAGRSYRPARSREEALAELRGEADRQFDPEVVEALARVVERERVAA